MIIVDQSEPKINPKYNMILYRLLQWPRGLRHEPSSPAPTLGLWVRIPLKARMSVCVYSVFVLLYV
jgi:hypothetical protein